MSHNKLLSMLGIARKAGKLSLGNDPAIEAIRNGLAYLILTASDLSQRTLRGICYAAEEKMIEILIIDNTMDEIEIALGRRTGIIAVNDAGFAEKLRTLCGKADSKQRNEKEISL